MKIDTKISIGFYGAGQMGGALARRIHQMLPYEINILDHHPEKFFNIPRINVMANEKEMFKHSNIIFLSIKPYQVDSAFLSSITNYLTNEKVLVSICAGIPLAFFLAHNSETNFVRIMPSLTCLTGKGSLAATFAQRFNFDKSILIEIFKTFGKLYEVEENLIDSITAISGSGPAFVGMFLDAMIDAAVNNGLKRELATALAVNTLEATCSLINEANFHPSLLKEKIASPAGTTMAGLCALEKEGFKHAVISAINETVSRAKQLGKK